MLPWLREDPDNRAILALDNASTRALAQLERLILEVVEDHGLPTSIVLLRAKPAPSQQAAAQWRLDRIDESRRIARRSVAPAFAKVERWASRGRIDPAPAKRPPTRHNGLKASKRRPSLSTWLRAPHRYRLGSLAEEVEALEALAARVAGMASFTRSGSYELVRQAEFIAKTLDEHTRYFIDRWSR